MLFEWQLYICICILSNLIYSVLITGQSWESLSSLQRFATLGLFHQKMSPYWKPVTTRIVRHVSLSDKPLVIVAADTDIFVLLIYAFHKSRPSEKWFMKIEKNRYLDIGDIYKTYEEEICDALPGYHSVTRYDTTSYPYKVGKVKPLKKMITQGKSNLLAPLEKQRLSKQDAEKILSFSFMQTIMYPGKQDEDFMETRICMYEQQKNKSSLTLLSDKHSAEAHVKRSNLQAYIWKQCVP